MTSGDVVALIVGIVPTIGVIWVSVSSHQTRRDTRAILHQVQNDHFTPDGQPINMRVEADERHQENSTLLSQILTQVAAIAARVAAVEGLANSINGRLSTVELTIENPPKRKRT